MKTTGRKLTIGYVLLIERIEISPGIISCTDFDFKSEMRLKRFELIDIFCCLSLVVDLVLFIEMSQYSTVQCL